MGHRVGFEIGHAGLDLARLDAAQDRVGQVVELVGELSVGERVAGVAGGILDFANQLAAVVESQASRGWERPRDSGPRTQGLRRLWCGP